VGDNLKSDAFRDCYVKWYKENQGKPFWDADVPSLDYDLLNSLIITAFQNGGEDSRTGILAHALDYWIAREFERAGFSIEGVWPRSVKPYVVDPEILCSDISKNRRVKDASDVLITSCGKANANIMGSAYVKQVDVGMSSWLAGPELLVSTKTMSGSFGKNLANRFEEAYGDVKNLRDRHPLAAHGFFFLADDSIQSESASFSKLVHMLHRLQRPGNVYDATALLLYRRDTLDEIELISPTSTGSTGDISPESFFETLIRIVLENAPEGIHVRAREIYPFE
jgi:hypothetical protein